MKIPQKEIDWAIQVAEKLPEKYHYVPSTKLAEVFENLKDEI